MELKKAELKHLLLLRHLPYSGNKDLMVSRLTAHDEHQSVYRSADALANMDRLLISQTVPFHSRSSHLNSAMRSTD